jgi:hypothetical protein
MQKKALTGAPVVGNRAFYVSQNPLRDGPVVAERNFFLVRAKSCKR